MTAQKRQSVVRTIARLTHIDLMAAIKSKRHNPILDSEIDIEEELINLKESLDAYHTSEESICKYPKMQAHLTAEKRDILKHCLGLITRMIHGKKLPRPYTKDDIDFAVKRLVRLVVDEARHAGKRLDADVMEILRPYLSIRQRLALRDFSLDMVTSSAPVHRAQALVGKLPLLRSR